MSGESRGYAAAFQQLESLAETYQVDNNPQHQQQHQLYGGGAVNPAFTALDYSGDGYSFGNTMTATHAVGGHQGPQYQQQQVQHHSVLMPNHQYYACNTNNNLNGAYQMMFQTQHEHQPQQQQQPQHAVRANSHVMPYFSDVSSNQQITSPHPASFASFDPLPMSYSEGHQRSSSWDDFMTLNSALFLQPEPLLSAPPAPVSAQQSYSSNSTTSQQAHPVQAEDDVWLSTLSVEVSGLSMEPLSGSDVVQRCQASMDDVTFRYVPCVDFLVQCQQELRKGQKLCANNAQQFFVSYVQPLPRVFHGKNQYTLSAETMSGAMDGLNQLVKDAKNAQRMGSEAVKNHFLGGMKDGESWGLRKWLSRQGNALQTCTTLECILTSLRKLDKSDDTTHKLAAILRPIAKKTLHKLQTGVPESYQEQSSAHPYLPFFHRLEAALRSMTQFEPEKDDVICLDDSDDEDEPECIPAPPPLKKRKTDIVLEEIGDDEPVKPAAKAFDKAWLQAAGNTSNDDGEGSSSGESDDESVVEIVNTFAASTNSPIDRDSDREWSIATTSPDQRHQIAHAPVVWPLPLTNIEKTSVIARIMASNVDRLAKYFDSGQQATIRPLSAPHGSFWEGSRYASALRILSLLLRQREVLDFIERVDENALIKAGQPPYSHVIKHPLSLRDILSSLIWNADAICDVPCGKDGVLPMKDLQKWNMWKGMDFFQATDLVFLNSLAYGKHIGVDKKDVHRSSTNKLRKILWDEINRIAQASVGNDAFRRKSIIPTRRAETSGFVVYKIQE